MDGGPSFLADRARREACGGAVCGVQGVRRQGGRGLRAHAEAGDSIHLVDVSIVTAAP